MPLVHNKARRTVARVSFGGGEPRAHREMEVVGNAPPPPPQLARSHICSASKNTDSSVFYTEIETPKILIETQLLE